MWTRTWTSSRAANDLVLSKHFDYGMICATEQAIIADKDVYDPLVQELKRRKACLVTDEEKAKLEQYMFGCTSYSGQTSKLNSVVPGKSPHFIANAAGFSIPEDTTIICAECKEVGENEPLTMEKLCPVQAVLKSPDKETGFKMCEQMLVHGAGHTAVIHTNNQDLVREYGVRMHACRVIWNSPSSLGGVGDIYNAIAPSLTLGCGSYGGNSVSGNVQAVNLINIKRIARRNNNMQWFKIPAKTYFEPNAIKYLRDMYGIEKAVIVCDKVMEQLGIVDKVIDQLRARFQPRHLPHHRLRRAGAFGRDRREGRRDDARGVRTRHHHRGRRRLPDGCGQDHVAAVRAPGNLLLRRA